MNTAVTLSAEEFKILHNSLCDLNRFSQFKEIEEIVERIRTVALKSAYEQDNAAFETKHDHYRAVQVGAGLKSTWSIYEVSDLGQPHPYTDAEYVVYDNHWGEGGEVVKAINGSTWAALWTAADAAIRDSGDTHHSFIESFFPIEDKPGYLRVGTGS